MNLLSAKPTARQLLAFLMGSALIVLWSLVAWSRISSEKSEIAITRRQTDTLALLFAQHTTDTFRTVDHVLLDLRQVLILHPADLQEEVKSQRNFLGDLVLQIAIFDRQGLLTHSSPGLPKVPSFFGGKEYFKLHQTDLQDKLFVSHPFKVRASGKWSIQLSRSIFENGRFAGVMVISVNPDYFINFYDKAGLGSDGMASIVRDSGEVMIRSSKQDRYVGKTISPSPYADPGAPPQGSYRRISQTDGVERLYSYVHLPDYGLSVIIGPSVDEVLATVFSQQRQILFAAMVVTLLMLLMAWKLLTTMRLKSEAQQLLTETMARLRSSHELLEKLSQNVPGMIYQYRLFADGRSTAPYASHGTEATYGVTQAQVLENTMVLFTNLHPDDRLAIDVSMAESAHSLQPLQLEYRLNHPHRGLRWLENRAQPEKLDDGSTLWHGHVRDITDKKNYEAAILAVNQELETFSYSVSHDLRAPLNTIDGFSHLLAKRLTGSEDEKALYFLARIRSGAAQMERLTTDLLALARVAKTTLEREQVDVSALTSRVVDDLRAREPESKTTVDIQAGITAYGDAGLLRVVLENLMCNAWKYSSRRDKPHICCGQKMDGNAETIFFVRDNGAGFDMRHAEKLFQPFQRLHGVAEFPGTGIGLATVSRIIMRHGGRIWAESEPNLGATFLFTLPGHPTVA